MSSPPDIYEYRIKDVVFTLFEESYWGCGDSGYCCNIMIEKDGKKLWSRHHHNYRSAQALIEGVAIEKLGLEECLKLAEKDFKWIEKFKIKEPY